MSPLIVSVAIGVLYVAGAVTAVVLVSTWVLHFPAWMIVLLSVVAAIGGGMGVAIGVRRVHIKGKAKGT